MFYYLSFTKSPARLAGGAVLVHETLDQVKEPRQAWGYNAGQRRVRRAPNLAYDTPIAAADGLRTADDTDMFNGAPDRYDWKLLGKKEICIPTNNYKVSSPEVKYEELLAGPPRSAIHPLRAAPRVGGGRYPEAGRAAYLLQAHPVPRRGQLERGGGRPVRRSRRTVAGVDGLPEELLRPAVHRSALDVFHDLQARRYHVQNPDNEEPGTIDFTQAIPDDSYFKPSALRRRGTR